MENFLLGQLAVITAILLILTLLGLLASIPSLTIRKVGGLWHWRFGRLGGSVYLTKASKQPESVK